MSNTLYEPFDFNKHKKEFTRYCEVIIDRTGKIYYATPSHQMFMVAYYGVKTGQLPKEFLEPNKPHLRQYSKMINVTLELNGIDDIEDFVQKKLGLVAVYYSLFIFKGKLNKRQKLKLKRLHNMGICDFTPRLHLLEVS